MLHKPLRSQTAVSSLEAEFRSKSLQNRKRIGNSGELEFEAQEIATQVFRLHYPLREIAAVHSYFNNEPVKPFLLSEHPSLTERQAGSMARPLRKFVVVDVYFLFGGNLESKNEDEAFVVEVTFPEEAERSRWSGIRRVRWADLQWNRLGNHPGDVPVRHLSGETFVNAWI